MFMAPCFVFFARVYIGLKMWAYGPNVQQTPQILRIPLHYPKKALGRDDYSSEGAWEGELLSRMGFGPTGSNSQAVVCASQPLFGNVMNALFVLVCMAFGCFPLFSVVTAFVLVVVLIALNVFDLFLFVFACIAFGAFCCPLFGFRKTDGGD